jgi:hypothetical protein
MCTFTNYQGSDSKVNPLKHEHELPYAVPITSYINGAIFYLLMRKKFLAGVTHLFNARYAVGVQGQKLQEGAIPATPSEYCVFQYFYEGQYKGVSTVICYMLVWSRV